MLGDFFAKEGKKATQFDMRFISIGVIFDLQCMVHKLVFANLSPANAIIQLFCESEATLQLKSWFSSVPSHSNISDGPSRLQFEPLLSLGCLRVDLGVRSRQRFRHAFGEWGDGRAWTMLPKCCVKKMARRQIQLRQLLSVN